MRILGLDPGSRITGIAVIEDSSLLFAESLRLGSGPLPGRLGRVLERVSEVVTEFAPQAAAVEAVFMSRNARSALVLGQARGAAVAGLVASGLQVHEYSPREVKQAIVGRGSADKQQIQHMVRVLLGVRSPLEEDAADALAVALCHRSHAETARRMPQGAR